MITLLYTLKTARLSLVSSRQQKELLTQSVMDSLYFYAVSTTLMIVFSVHLARRVLQLEKINTSLRQEVDREKKKMLQLAEEVRLFMM